MRRRAACATALLGALAFAGIAAANEREAAIRRAAEVEERVVRAVEAVGPAVVTLTVRRPSAGAEVAAEPGEAPARPKEQVSGGSGVIVSEDGFVLTNDHVIAGASGITVGLPDGRRFPARHVASDETGDVALLKVDAKGLPYARLGDSRRLRIGEWVIALGNPFGLARDQRPSASLGIVSGVNRYQGGGKIYGAAIQTDAAINPGNSGGPLVDLEGRVVGVNGRISIRGGERVNVGVGFAIPSSQIAGILADLKAGRAVRHGYLGIRFYPEGEGPGILIWQVDRKSAAERAGIKAQDVLLELEGVKIDHPVRLQNVLSQLPAGRTVRVKLLRDGKELHVTATLAARPEEQP